MPFPSEAIQVDGGSEFKADFETECQRRGITETDLEREFVQAFKGTTGTHFVWTSSQNIDRLVTILRAAKKTDHLYTAVVLEATAGTPFRNSIRVA